MHCRTTLSEMGLCQINSESLQQIVLQFQILLGLTAVAVGAIRIQHLCHLIDCLEGLALPIETVNLGYLLSYTCHLNTIQIVYLQLPCYQICPLSETCIVAVLNQLLLGC